jgi:flagellar hook-associated protein 1
VFKERSMSLYSALGNALSGLSVSQAGIELVSQNIANADSVGYARRRLTTTQVITGSASSGGTRVATVERVLDRLTQKQMRAEGATSGYTRIQTEYAKGLDFLFGKPGSEGALDTIYNRFIKSVQDLGTDPSASANRTVVVSAAEGLTSHLQSLSESVQVMRTQAENTIAAKVTRVNDLLTGIAENNRRLLATPGTASRLNPSYLDERDKLLSELSQYIDIRTNDTEDGSISIFTTGGLQLIDRTAATRLSFTATPEVRVENVYSPIDAERSVGTIKAITTQGQEVDALTNNYIRSGEIGALIEARDSMLTTAQRQLDEIAASTAQALGSTKRVGTAASFGGGNGFELDIDNLQSGDALTLEYTDTATGKAKRIFLVRTDGNAPATIDPSLTLDPEAQVIGIDFSSGISNAIGFMTAALSSRFDVGSPGGTVVRIVDDGSGTTAVTALTARVTATSLTSGSVELPFFVDGSRGNIPYSGSFEEGAQITGFSQRIRLNPNLKNDPSRLTVYNTTPLTPSGDATRPTFLLDALTKTSIRVSAATNIGSSDRLYDGTASDFVRRTVEYSGAQYEAAQQIDDGQQVVFKALEDRMSETSGVNVDQELSQLVQLQTAYAANARVISAVQDLLDILMRI